MKVAYTSEMKIDKHPHPIKELKSYLIKNRSSWSLCHIGSSKHGYLAYNIPAAFDIETNSFYDKGVKRACLVSFQIGVDGTAFIGRTWNQLKQCFQIIEDELNIGPQLKLIMYVHNLGYEFQFIRKQLGPWESIFAGESRVPYKAITTSGVEFRDSLVLSGLSLEETAKTKLHHYKFGKLNSWDYEKQRHSGTPLSKGEIKYAIYDVLVTMAYIKECMDAEGGYLNKIPMTRTGYVRRDCRKSTIRKDKQYKQLMKALTVGGWEYDQLKAAYSGGFTHASHNYANKILHGVGSFDFASSYPSVIVCEKFPMGIRSTTLPSDTTELNDWLNQYCVTLHITITNVRPKIDYEHIISLSKCVNVTNPKVDNGRIISADSLEIWMTDLDFRSLNVFYSYDSLQIHHCTTYYKDYLPTPLVERVLYYYKQKTNLKHKKGREIEYNLYKEMTNSIYGMLVMDIVRDNVEYFLGEWTKMPGFEDQIEEYNKSDNRFTYYPWGVWVTAYARYNLLCGIAAAGDSYVYSDTDSIKYIISKSGKFMNYVNKYNDLIKYKMLNAMQHHNLPMDDWMPENVDNIPQPLGYWDDDGQYEEFKTLGAKRYFCKFADGSYKVTLAGSSKKKTTEYLSKLPNPMEAFSDNLVIDKEHSGRTICTYVDEEASGTLVDYRGVPGKYHELSYIHMEAGEYNMKLSDEYVKYLKGEIDINILA